MRGGRVEDVRTWLVAGAIGYALTAWGLLYLFGTQEWRPILISFLLSLSLPLVAWWVVR